MNDAAGEQFTREVFGHLEDAGLISRDYANSRQCEHGRYLTDDCDDCGRPMLSEELRDLAIKALEDYSRQHLPTDQQITVTPVADSVKELAVECVDGTRFFMEVQPV